MIFMNLKMWPDIGVFYAWLDFQKKLQIKYNKVPIFKF